jgi:MoxR-like ATPase
MTTAVSLASEPSPTVVKLRNAVDSALEGKSEVTELCLIALLARGHVLLEDVPGVGKTTLARAMATAVGGEWKRVQFTSDLLPSDVLGVSVYDQRNGDFIFRQGPVFCNVLPLPDPFFVVATQNPQDFAGTYPLPESQLDRFMVRLRIGYPPPHVESRLYLTGHERGKRGIAQVIDPSQLVALQRECDRVELDQALATYLQAVLSATRSSPALSLGASPRAGINLAQAARGRALLHGRTYCIADDIHDLAVPVLAHRVRLAAHAEGYVPSRDENEAAIRDLVARVPVPL